ncbi:MAG: PAS domain S-box protein [Elusimicrobia bacterium]|nr:PAS domain S-box protein [Elusimicrobiota bacterium]
MLRETHRPLALVLLALVVAGALAALTGFLLYRAEKANFLAGRLGYLAVVADLKADAVRDFHHERLHDLDIYVSNIQVVPGFEEALRGDAAKLRALSRIFTPLFDYGDYESVALVDRRGRVVLALPPGAEPPRPSPSPGNPLRFLGTRRTASGTVVFEYEAAIAGGSRLITRVRSSALLGPLTERWPGVEKTAETIIYERAGDDLVALNALRFKKDSALATRIPLTSETLAARAARGEAGPLLGRDYRGVECYAAVRDLRELEWILVAKADERELLAPLIERVRLAALASAGGFGLVSAMFVLFLRTQADRLSAEAKAERLLLATAIEQAGESILITDRNARILYANPACARVTGYTREELLGRNPSVVKSGRHEAPFYKAMWETLLRGEVWNGRFSNRRKDGTIFEEDSTITPVRDAGGTITHFIAVKRDVSAVKSLEEQLFHSQKMEAIGRLAGGIAHDFNNILTTINGYAEMLSDSAPPESQAAGDLAEILGAGRRAAMLTRQLLTFSRRAPADPVVLDLRASVRGMEKILRRTLGEDVRLSFDLPEDPLWVRSDPGQIDQVLMNLAVNARDAMPRGGTLTVRAHAARLESDEVRSLEVIPAGDYAVLLVGDDGAGMSGSILARIFEPFFTTKEKGKGTGLGLATVFGIVKQNKGHISVDSAPGRGSTFSIHLPPAPAPAGWTPSGAAAQPASFRGDETVLVVEDQSEVLRLVARALTPQGYRVISCGSAKEALETARAVESPIHLLLTDVVMPGMGGAELAEVLGRTRPETRVLFMSGYTDGRLDGLVEAHKKADLLLKPFTAEQLCRRVRSALDGEAPRMA